MSAQRRQVIAVLLATLLVAPPGFGASSKPLGVVLEARNASIRATDGLPGTTVFAGDTVVTSHAGRMRIRIGEAQIEVMPQSVVVFEELESVAGATVVQGTVGFSSPETGSVAVRAAGIVIRPQPKRATQGQVTLVGPTELLVTSYRGPLELTMGDESLTVPEGTTYRVQGDSRGPGPAGAGADAARRAPFRAFLITFAVVVVPLVTFITIDLLASPSSIF
ncbi:MAG: hypothetical protein M1453_08380 [Acidobacteria bacterium]|nr:hypothetical protein [Acidobacteriota bacterium]MCL5287991.1 hypothetical protein [Acidobacteriota bacterium]